jgi:hypothetical protein
MPGPYQQFWHNPGLAFDNARSLGTCFFPKFFRRGNILNFTIQGQGDTSPT